MKRTKDITDEQQILWDDLTKVYDRYDAIISQIGLRKYSTVLKIKHKDVKGFSFCVGCDSEGYMTLHINYNNGRYTNKKRSEPYQIDDVDNSLRFTWSDIKFIVMYQDEIKVEIIKFLKERVNEFNNLISECDDL